MRYILIAVIRMYWKLVPINRRRKCIFIESCSCHVYKISKTNGFVAGAKSFIQRFKQCRSGYTLFETPDGEEWVILKDLSVVKRKNTVL